MNSKERRKLKRDREETAYYWKWMGKLNRLELLRITEDPKDGPSAKALCCSNVVIVGLRFNGYQVTMLNPSLEKGIVMVAENGEKAISCTISKEGVLKMNPFDPIMGNPPFDAGVVPIDPACGSGAAMFGIPGEEPDKPRITL